MIEKNILNKKVGFISLGCDKNRVDLENMIFQIKSAGFEIVNKPQEANIILINTCAFLKSARRESIENILEMSQYKSNKLEKLIVTGCINELNYEDLQSSLPEVDAFVKIKDNDKIVQIICDLYKTNLNVKNSHGRVITTPNHYAYLKISEGCNNFCTYCLIPYIRGRYKSIPIDILVNETKNLANQGVKEIILVAQDITKYGIDIYGKKSLVKLIREISKINKIEWIRLLYCYPEEVDDDLILEIKNNDKVVKYLDIPLQHISNKILKAMNRRSTKEDIEQLFNKLKKNIPNIVLRTTFILGFPGETDQDFNEILDFIKIHKINNVGFFKYSREEGTVAYNLSNQISETIKDDRLKIATQLQFEIQNKLLDNYINQNFKVIIDESFENYSIGRFYGQCPNIDSDIYINQKLNLGEFYNIKIINKLDYDLEGEKV